MLKMWAKILVLIEILVIFQKHNLNHLLIDIDDNQNHRFKKGRFSCTSDKFKKILSKKHVDLTKVHLVPGFYDKTLNEATKKMLQLKKAAVIWIDCDLYSSTVPVLDFITDYAQNGTILVFDDYFCFGGDPNKGEQKAFREWLKRNPSIKVTEFHKIGWHGNSFIIHRSALKK